MCVLNGCAGVITAVGGKVPTKMDMFAGWIVKCLPMVHGFFLRVRDKENSEREGILWVRTRD